MDSHEIPLAPAEKLQDLLAVRFGFLGSVQFRQRVGVRAEDFAPCHSGDPDPHPEEKAIVAAAPELADYVAGLKQRSRTVITLALRQLLRLVREYPREPLLGAVREAGRYGLYDLDRLERMILRRVTREYFLLEGESGDD
jgi:hypothetical protein